MRSTRGHGREQVARIHRSEKRSVKQPLLKSLPSSYCSDTTVLKALHCGPVTSLAPWPPLSTSLTPATLSFPRFPETPSFFLPLDCCISCSLCPEHFSRDCFLSILPVSAQRHLLQPPWLDEIGPLPLLAACLFPSEYMLPWSIRICWALYLQLCSLSPTARSPRTAERRP